MIERYQIRYFLAVVEAGTFSRAATQVNVTQPTLSTGIAKLEAALGAPVFVRNSRRLHLTSAGARLLAHARAIEREFNAVEVSNKSESRSLPIRLGVLSTIPTRIIEAIALGNATAAEPDALEIVEGQERDLLSRLERGRLDLALTILRPGDRRFECEHLREEGYALAVASSHPVARQAAVDPASLAGEVMIVRRNCELLAETSRFFIERGVRPRFSFRTFNDDKAAAMVRARLGITVVPDSWSDWGVRLVGLAGFDYKRQLGLLYGDFKPRDHGSWSTVGAVRQAFA